MSLKIQRFEVGPDGTGITVANSDDVGDAALENVTPGAGGTINYEATGAIAGSFSAEFTQPTAGNTCFIRLTDTAADQFATSFYLNMNTLPSAESQFPLAARTTGDAHVIRCQMLSTGTIRVYDSASNILGITSTALAGATTYRLELWAYNLNTTNTVVGFATYVGDSVTPMSGNYLYFTGVTTNALVGMMRVGKASSVTLDPWRVDNWKCNIGSGVPLGPFSGWTQSSYGFSVQIG